TGCARTGVSTGCASAISGAYGLALGTAAVAFAGRDGAVCGRLGTGFSAIGDCAGAGGGDVDFSATTSGVAEAEGFGVGLFFANLPFGVGVALALLFLAWT